MHPLIAIPATLLLVYRAWSRQSLTPIGILTAALTAVAHAIHPWSVFFTLLATFFLAGTAVTKVKHAYKSTLTTSSLGGLPNPSTPHPRTSTQVLANSLTASVLILLHTLHLQHTAPSNPHTCLPAPQISLAHKQTHTHSRAPLASYLPYAILAHYAAVTADTFSSELGILARGNPILLTALPAIQRVPRGTNGGVTTTGTLAGALGGFLIAIVAVLLTPLCESWSVSQKSGLVIWVVGCGVAGSLLDSALGGWLQASVVDVRSGKVVEGDGGGKVLYDAKGSNGNDSREQDLNPSDTATPKTTNRSNGRHLLSGHDYLSNNGVNFTMASLMSLFGLLTSQVIF